MNFFIVKNFSVIPITKQMRHEVTLCTNYVDWKLNIIEKEPKSKLASKHTHEDLKKKSMPTRTK